MDVGNLQFAWKIKNFSKLQAKQICSDVFSLGPYKWKLIVYPKGVLLNEDLSIYIRVADLETLHSDWSLKAKFFFTLVDQIDNKSSITKSNDRAHILGSYFADRAHIFSAASRAWGYSSYISLKELHDHKKGYLVEDTCIIKVDITVYADDYLESHHVQSKETNQVDGLAKTVTDEEIDQFFGDLNSVIFPKKFVSLEEEAKEALSMIEEALNMVPADLYNPGRISQLTNAFDVLSLMDDGSILTSEQKEKILSMKELFERAAQAVKDKMMFIEKEINKKSLDQKLGRYLINFEKAKAETIQNEQDIVVLQEQLDEKKRKRESSTSMQQQMFNESKKLKTELDVLLKDWPVYEARMNAAEEHEKVAGKEWSEMKQLFSSLKKPS